MTMTAVYTGIRRSIRVAAAASAAAAIVSVTQGVLAQAPGPWKPLFNGKDLTGWTIAAGRGGGGGGAAERHTGQHRRRRQTGRSRTACSSAARAAAAAASCPNEQFKDFELELDFMLAEHGTRVLGGADRRRSRTNASKDKTCLYNSGISFRTGYQLNLGRREAGEYIGIVVHRKAPGAIRGNVLWLDRGDDKFPNLRKKQDWNQLRISAKGRRTAAAAGPCGGVGRRTVAAAEGRRSRSAELRDEQAGMAETFPAPWTRSSAARAT